LERPPGRFRDRRLAAVVVFDVDRNDSARAVVEVEHERRVEGSQAAEVSRIEASG
jgi:hypothetical protein